MLIGGLQKLTLIDYPGKIAATVFTVGCNFSCAFCHNPELVDPEKIKNQPIISEKVFFDFLESRKGILEGICVTGGEPTLQKDLTDFIKKIKELGFSVKLDTNGSNPEMLKKLIDSKSIDYIAMDIKGPLKSQKSNFKSQILRSIEIIKNSGIDPVRSKSSLTTAEIPFRTSNGVDYEFRTTVVPVLHTKEDILEIARELSPAKKYFLQQFRPGKVLDPVLEKEKTYPMEKLIEFSKAISFYFDYCGIRE